jgi:hypothetical protein
MPTLREIAQQQGWNIDWNRLNSSGNDDGNQYRRQIFDMVNQSYKPYGTSGATFLDPYGRSGEVDVTQIPDQLQGTQWQDMATRLGAKDAADLRGMLARGRGQELYNTDRGMYNEYVADLGNMKYDDQLGWLPGEGGFQKGNRADRAFNNMQTWGPAAVLAAGFATNGLLGSPGSATGGSGGGAFGAEGGLKPGAVSGGGAGSSGLLGGAEGATGAFDTAGWQGTGINGATGTRGMLGQMAYNAQGFLNNPVGWAMNNPVDAIRGASSLYNLGSSIIGPRGNASQGGNTGSKGGNGSTGNINLPQQQYYVNPITQMQLAQLYGGRK